MAGERMSEQEARERFPYGAIWSPEGRWEKVPTESVRRNLEANRIRRYLPLEAPDTTCPECGGEGGWLTAPDDWMPCPAGCDRGKVPADSILTRLREGRFP